MGVGGWIDGCRVILHYFFYGGGGLLRGFAASAQQSSPLGLSFALSVSLSASFCVGYW